MAFWNRESEAEKQTRIQREQENQASLEALKKGGLPLQAIHRLNEARATNDRFFTSDLTSNEHLLAREAGYEPIGQVMGSAFYKVAYGAYYSGGCSTTGELTTLSHAQLAARELAVNRLAQEAKLLGAHGVIGVRLKLGNYDWSANLVEFTAIGTAIRIPGRKPSAEPFTSDLSGQEFWQLHQAGYWPRTIVLGVCSYYIYGTYQTRALLNNYWGSGMSNQEVSEFTLGFQRARHIAMGRLSTDIRRAKAEGCVGMHIDMEVEDIEYELNEVTHRDLLVQFIAVGTAISHDDQPQPPPAKTLTMVNLRDKSRSLIEIDNIRE
jgi:uncharacterized protein YbjQ (UPF0145 family)